MSKAEDLAKLEKQLKGNCQVCSTKNVSVGLTRRNGKILHVCEVCTQTHESQKANKKIEENKKFAKKWMGLNE